MKIDQSLSLEEKLALIDQGLANTEAVNKKRAVEGLAPIDPADATMCIGCQ